MWNPDTETLRGNSGSTIEYIGIGKGFPNGTSFDQNESQQLTSGKS